MAENTLNTRLKLKYDTYANWTSTATAGEGANLVLLAGEVGLCVIPASTGQATTEPTVMMKVGDGTTAFGSLPWTSAKAADVYSWAKASSAPSYVIDQDTADGHKIRIKLDSYTSDWITIPDSSYTHPAGSAASKTSGLYKIATDSTSHVSSVTAVAKSDITALGIPGQDTTYEFADSYNVYTNKGATVATVTNAIGALDKTVTGLGAGKTITALSEADGIISATASDISITKSQVSDFSHAHGNLTNDGKVGTASGKVITTTTGGAVQASDTIGVDNVPSLGAGKITSGTFDVARIPDITLSKVTDAGAAAAKGVVTAVDATAALPTSGAVKTYVDTEVGKLVGGMVFKGSLGTGGTISTLPTASADNVGYTYKVITAGTYASQAADVGDLFVGTKTGSTSYTWTLIPSGDEPSGTVTSVGATATDDDVVVLTVSGSPVTSSGTLEFTASHAASGATAGNYGDTTAQTPVYGATFKVPSFTVDAKGHITAAGEHTVKIPSSDNTNQKVKAGSVTFGDSDVVNIEAGSNVTVTGDSTNKKITIAATDTTYTFDGTYDASTNQAATVSTVANAIKALDSTASIASVSSDVVTIKAGLTETDGKIANNSSSDITLAKIAKTGNANDLSQTSGDLLIFDCGSSTTNV